MSTAIWGEQESQPDQDVTMPLLKQLLVQMIAQFGCNGACIALHDEKIDQMEIKLHLRLRTSNSIATEPGRIGGNTDSVHARDR